MNRRIGKLPGSSSVHEIRFETSIAGFDELISPPETDVFLSPGFVDVQVNGFAGVDYNDPGVPIEQIAKSVQVMFSTGVTRCFPTIITGPEERITGALRNMTKAKRALESANRPEGAAIEAFHVEGPNISPDDGPRGAHPREFVRPPSLDEFKRWQEAADGMIRLITVSPEWPEIPDYVQAVARTGVVVSVGHTKASSDQIRAVVQAGATMSTHLGNGAHASLHKTANYIWDQLADDRLTPSFIVDGIHLPSSFLRAALHAKGVERSVLVTDAVMPAMCKPGIYRLGTAEVELQEGNKVVLTSEDRLAGSALRMDAAIGNTVRMAGISLRDAVSMATVNPARVCRVADRQRGFNPGEKADVVRYRWDEKTHSLTVIETILNGVSVYGEE